MLYLRINIPFKIQNIKKSGSGYIKYKNGPFKVDKYL